MTTDRRMTKSHCAPSMAWRQRSPLKRPGHQRPNSHWWSATWQLRPDQATTAAPTGAGRRTRAVEQIGVAVGEEDLATSLAGERAAEKATSDKSPDPADTPLLDVDIDISEPHGAADQEARALRSGTKSTRHKRSGSKGGDTKTVAAVSQADGDEDATAAHAPRIPQRWPNPIRWPMPRLQHHEFAPPAPTGPAGAEPPSGTPRTGSVPVAAADRLTEGGSAARSQPTETTQSARNTVDTARFVQRVARAFLTGRVEAGRDIRLRLHPPELGHLRLQIKVQDGAMTARMEAENPLARTLLLDHLAGLRHRLAEHNIKIERFEVDLMQQPPNGSDNHATDSQTDRRPTASPRTADRRCGGRSAPARSRSPALDHR